jgi:hypothetical protein
VWEQVEKMGEKVMEIKQDFTAIGLLEHKSNNDFFFYW